MFGNTCPLYCFQTHINMTQLKTPILEHKKVLLLIIFLINSINYQGYSQELFELMQEEDIKVNRLERLGNKYYKNRDKGKGSGYKLYMRNLYWAKRNQNANGRIISNRKVVDESNKFRKLWSQNASPDLKNNTKNNGWQELGPFSWTRTRSWSPGLGRIVSIAVEPANQQIIYAGSPGGGIWKSVDAGQSWEPKGDQMVNMSIWAIAIDPNNTNVVYLGNGAGQIMKSTNAGNSWSEIYQVNGVPRTILISPAGSRIFIGTTKSLYRSTNGGSSFSRVLNDRAEDVKFKPGNTNVVYSCGTSFYRSTNGGGSFSRITSGIVSSERMKMAVTPANPNAVYLVQKRRSSFGYLYRSLDGGSSFSIRSSYNTVSTNQVYFTQASRDMAIAVSDTNANEVHVGGMNYSRSLNGGSSFTTLAAWNQPNDRSYVHADIEVIDYINGTLYIGTDGGVFRSRDRGDNTTDLTQGGLAVRQYYRIGNSVTDPNMIVGGAQDNGTNIMSGSNRQFKEWLGADGMECFVDHKNSNVVYGTTQFGNLYKSTDKGNSIGSISKPGDFSGEWVTPFMNDPIDNKMIYVGYRNLYRSNDGGRRGSWRNITSNINLPGNLDEMAIAASNNNYIYIAEEGRVWRTKNGQSNTPTWTEVSNFRGDVNFIAVDPNNPERVAIAATGSRVYVSNNAGNSWTNIRGNLPNISAQCLVFDDTSANGLYVGMQSGVYYTNDNLSSWVPFSTNLPGVQTTDLEIHYPTRKLRLATYGRGIWESDLYNEQTNPDDINPPSDLTAQITEKDVTLNWKDNSTNENGFTIQRNDGSGFERIDFVSRGVQTYEDKNLENGNYSYRVRAYDSDSYSDFSNTTEVVIGDTNPPNVLDNCTGCTVYDTNSEETGNADHAKQRAADGDPNTYWHTNWYDDNSSHPHFIAIDFGEQRELVGFSYLGRQQGTTGMVKDYILFGWDGSSWQQLSTGSFQKSTLKQSVELNNFSCRYVYFRALSEVDGKRWASVAELSFKYLAPSARNFVANKQSESTPPPVVDLQDFDGIIVYPVPFRDHLTVKGITSKKEVRSIQLIGNNGVVQPIKVEVTEQGIQLDAHALSKGFYILRIQKDGVEKSVKVFKQ
ncbi:Por secretion system C-terminal sorting domain-containing protein [Aquimarina spongiae]|uniref:Por secretion system C-terminal sorting domain-containing protein n=2 Tax=Aquimarina spongiae TaxID=570521 RepID=A0A1M6JQP6_9FLAO|nr:Por secretion system C-terminal sorting domain-containing protein [Aquimarina spongiae]